MPVSKKRKYPQKRNKQAQPGAGGGYVARFNFSGLDIPNELISDLHSEGTLYYNRGKEDRANGAAALTLAGFTKELIPHEPGLPEAFDTAITQAQYAQYMDGYIGAEYRERVIFERDDI